MLSLVIKYGCMDMQTEKISELSAMSRSLTVYSITNLPFNPFFSLNQQPRSLVPSIQYCHIKRQEMLNNTELTLYS